MEELDAAPSMDWRALLVDYCFKVLDFFIGAPLFGFVCSIISVEAKMRLLKIFDLITLPA